MDGCSSFLTSLLTYTPSDSPPPPGHHHHLDTTISRGGRGSTDPRAGCRAWTAATSSSTTCRTSWTTRGCGCVLFFLGKRMDGWMDGQQQRRRRRRRRRQPKHPRRQQRQRQRKPTKQHTGPVPGVWRAGLGAHHPGAGQRPQPRLRLRQGGFHAVSPSPSLSLSLCFLGGLTRRCVSALSPSLS